MSDIKNTIKEIELKVEELACALVDDTFDSIGDMPVEEFAEHLDDEMACQHVPRYLLETVRKRAKQLHAQRHNIL